MTNNQLPAISIIGVILGFDRSFFWISLPETETQVIKVELCHDIWLNFALVTVKSCAVYMEMQRDSVIVLLHNAKLQATSHCCLYKFSPKHSPIKDVLSCGPINMKFEPHEICSICIPISTDRTDRIVKVMWAELRKSGKCGIRQQNCEYCAKRNNDLVKMTK